MRLGIPPVETAHDRHRTRIRSPHAEHGARFAIVSDKVSPHLFVHAVVAALIEEVQILISKEVWVGEGRFGRHASARRLRPPVYRKKRRLGYLGSNPRLSGFCDDPIKPFESIIVAIEGN